MLLADPLTTWPKEFSKSISQSRTFNPLTTDRHFLWSELLSQLQRAFLKARRSNYQAGKVFIFLKTKELNYRLYSFKLLAEAVDPFLIKERLKKGFEKIYQKKVFYQAVGCYLTELGKSPLFQSSLFLDSFLLPEENETVFSADFLKKSQITKQQSGAGLALPLLRINIVN